MQIESNTAESTANGQGIGSTPASVATADGALSQISREFHNFLADIEDLIKKTTSLTGEDLDLAKAKLYERIEAAKESIQEMNGAIDQQVRKSAVVANNYVHEQPWQAIGIGAAAGVLLGFVLARRE